MVGGTFITIASSLMGLQQALLCFVCFVFKPTSVVSTCYTFMRDYARASMELPNLISRIDACVEVLVEVHIAADEDERER